MITSNSRTHLNAGCGQSSGTAHRGRPARPLAPTQLSVAAEVFVFFVAGPWLLRVLTPAGAIALAAVAAAGRWLIAAFTADLVALILTQPLCAAALACTRLLANTVPAHLAATAQALYGTVGVGAGTALLTLLSGWLYAGMGPRAFAVMSVLCLLALPLAAGLRRRQEPAG
jgi:MFS transporter, PPP family, 3-phenylpropionic acid transporter